MKQKKYIFIFSLFLVPLFINSQDLTSARSIGLAFSPVTSSYGVDALGINPANFDLHKQLPLTKNQKRNKTTPKMKDWFEISVLSLGGGYGSDNSFKFYNDYTDYLTVNYDDLVNFFTDLNSVIDFKLNVLPDEQTNLNFDFELRWISFNYSNPYAGAFNIAMTDKVSLTSIVSGKDEFLSFTSTSNPDGSYNMNNFMLNQKESAAWWIRKYSAGYAKQFDFGKKSVIKSISLGFSAAFVHGFGNVTTSQLNLTGNSWGIRSVNGVNHVDSVVGHSSHFIRTSSTDYFRGYSDGRTTRFNLFPQPAGKGYSFDFGAALQITDYIRIAASVIELGKIKWDYNTFVSNDNNSFAYYDFYVSNEDPTYRRLVDDIKGVESRDSNIVYETDMPVKYRAGISVKPSEMLTLEFSYMNEKSIISGVKPRNYYALGGEVIPLPFLPLRAGISYDDRNDFNISLGAGLRFLAFNLDLGVYGLNQLILGRRFIAAVTTKFTF